MSRFNTPKPTTRTTNHAGGEGFTLSPKMEFVAALVTSFAEDKFYEKATARFDRVKELLAKIDPEFAAKAIIFARDEFNMRSMSHAGAAELAPYASGKAWARSFYKKVVVRPDDMMEIFAYNGERLTSAMKAGFRAAFDKFDAYQLAKYRNENKKVKLVDMMKLVHPVGTGKNRLALKKLKNGDLKQTKTWENELSAAGKSTDSEKAKADVWKDQVMSGKIGYMALLRNLRNIMQHRDPAVIDRACALLTDPKAVKNSRVLPFRFYTAYDELRTDFSAYECGRQVQIAISKAATLSCANVPSLEGKTLVVVDVSGSMRGNAEKKARMFGSVLYKSLNADMVSFATSVTPLTPDPTSSVMSIMDGIYFTAGGTNLAGVYLQATKKYDRIIVLTDGQGYRMSSEGSEAHQAFLAYKRRKKCDTKLYYFDLEGYSKAPHSRGNIHHIPGFSDKVFDLLGAYETDPKALLNKIEEIVL